MKLALLPIAFALLPPDAQATERLDGVGIATSIVGNSVDGLFGDVIFFEFYALDGTIHGVGDDGPYTGHWTIEDDRMCVDFDGIVDCYYVSLDGHNVDWISEFGEVEGTGLLLEGDPRDLEAGGGVEIPEHAVPGLD